MARQRSPRAATLALSVLGPPVLATAGGTRIPLRTRKHLALLYLLARHAGRPVPREQVVELLWSEDAPQLAKHSLSQSVSLVNKALGQEAILQSGRDRLLLAEGALRLDVAEFEQLVAAGRMAEGRALWRGPLLDGLWLKRAPRFEEWLERERERLLRVLRQTVHAELDALRRAGDHGRRRIEAERMLELDGLDERAMLAWLEAVTLGGDRALALRRYGEFEQQLREEVEAEPSAALRAWAKRQRKGEVEPAPMINRLHEVTVLPTVEPVYGRAEEFGQLWSAWEQAKAGQGRMLIVQGESGIGKSALVTMLANQVHVAGSSVAFVRCYRIEKAVPFAPLSALIRQLARLPGFVATSPTWIGELTRLVPELRERYPHVPHPMAIDDSARYRLSDATVQTATSVAEEQPLLIIVDDIQDADEATLAALHYLGRQSPTLPLLMVVVHRPSKEATEYERVFVETARAAGFGSVLQVPNLNEESLYRIVLDVFARRGRQVEEHAARKISARARGRPLRVIDEALRAMATHGEQLESKAETEDIKPADRDRHTPRYITWPLHPNADRLLALLAVAGRPVHDYEIASILEMGPSDLSIAAASTSHAGLTSRSGSVLDLSHDTYREVVEATVPIPLLNAVRSSLAAHLARNPAGNPAVFYEAATHYQRAGSVAAAEECAVKALRFAESLGSIRGKVEAIELIRGIKGSLLTQQAVELGWCLLGLKEFQKLYEVCEELESCSGEGSPALADSQYLRLAAAHEVGALGFEEIKDRLATLTSGNLAFAHLPDALVLLLRTADKTGDLGVMKAAVRQLRQLSESGVPALRAYAEYSTGYLIARYYLVERAIPHLRRAAQLAEESRNWTLQQAARDGLGITLKQSGQVPQSIEEFEIALDLARKMLTPHAEASGLQNRGLSEMLLGDLDSAEASFAQANSLGDAGWGYKLFNHYNLAVLALYRNELSKAAAAFTQLYHRARMAGATTLAADAAAMRALVGQRSLDKSGFLAAMQLLDEVSSGLSQHRLSWVDLAARAWRLAWVGNEPTKAVEAADAQCRGLRRRDAAHWLSLEAEIVRIEEWAWGSSERRQRVVREARALNCRFVELSMGQPS